MFAPSSCSVGKRNCGAIFKAQIMAENTENNKLSEMPATNGPQGTVSQKTQVSVSLHRKAIQERDGH